jgi:hypothetical protein
MMHTHHQEPHPRHQTLSDLCAVDPSFVSARSGIHLSDRQLMHLFEQICASTGVTRWMSPEDGRHFDVNAEDVRTELRRIFWRGTAGHKLDLAHALRVIAWSWEREALCANP